MCGICGIASAAGAVDPARLAAMSETLVRRGPDSAGAFVEGGVGLAVRRLEIVDPGTGDQPVANEDGTVMVVQDGAIYNYSELRHELERQGHRFRTIGDTEVLAHLYEQHGDSFVGRLRGMFAVAIWDTRRERLLLARDRFGIKPLVYRTTAGELSFASELRALPRGEIDLDALDCFLAFNSIPAPLTIFDGARKLPPGQLLLWEDGEARLERFARPGPVRADELRTNEDPELIEELRGRLRDSVRAHLAGDVPVGALLSGGLDSALLAALAAEESSEPLRTFSIGFAGRSVDELAGARLVAERYGTRHRELVVRPDVALLLPALADAFDEPCADPSALPTYLVSRLAAEDVKVALSGAGGDELFGSYAAPAAKEVFSREALTELTGRTASGAELHARPQDVDPGLQLVDDLLVKTDRASTAHSLEARVPFLDTVVTNLAFALPTRHQVRGLRRPVLLRRAAEPLLPRRIVHGRKRRFSVPAAEWLRGELEPFVRATLSAGTLRRQGFFRPEAVTRLVDEHVAGAAHRGHRLWALLAFTLWYERHVEGDPGTAELPEALVERSA